MEFEKSIGVYSPDGRLIQLEYAQQASELGSLVVFASNGSKICVSFENRLGSKLLIEDDKLMQVDEDVCMWYSFSGLKPDSYKVYDHLRSIYGYYTMYLDESPDINIFTHSLSKYIQYYTVHLEMRPLGIRSVLFSCEGGKSKINVLDPDGNYTEYLCGAIGHDSGKVCKHMEECENDDIVYKSVSSLAQVVQTDRNKVSSFILSSNGCQPVDEAVIGDILMNCAK